jgi:transcription antitermination factor NusG
VRQQFRNIDLISSKFGHGGARANSGGARPNSGGYRPGSGGKFKPRVVYLPRPVQAQWYCVRARHGSVVDAAAEIWLQGFEVFEATIWKPATRRRRNVLGAMIPARPAGERPLFGSYILSRFRLADFWRARDDLPSVEGVLGLTCGTATPIPDWIIGQIRGRCDASGCYHERGDTPNSLVGTLMRVLDGPFTSFEGLCDWSDGQNVRVALAIFGRDCPTVFDQTQVEAA